MATLVSDPIRFIADEWENRCGYASAVLSGIVPDSRHLDNGGYHCSVEDLRRFGNSRDYSNTRPDDKDRNLRYGAAVDVSMSPSDMRKCHDRVRRVWADKTDPRRKYINAINTWDGSGDAVRLDFYANTAGYASADHKWHDHLEERRRYLLDMAAARAIVSMLRGDSKATYLATIGQGEDDMSTEAEGEIHSVFVGMFNGGSSMGRTVDPDGAGAGKASNSVVAKLDYIMSRLDGVAAGVTTLSGKDFTDESAIVQGVLAGLTPEKIAAAIPPTMAKQVAEELARRIAE